MTTNETSFFRDSHPFDTLRKSVIPGLIERRAASPHLADLERGLLDRPGTLFAGDDPEGSLSRS